jgi:hypothetical protein
MSKPKIGERLPYLLGKLKAPRVLQRLEQAAERARPEQRPKSNSSRRCSRPRCSPATPPALAAQAPSLRDSARAAAHHLKAATVVHFSTPESGALFGAA